MKVVNSLLNRSEEAVLRELQNIASDNGMRAFVKPRLSDVIQKGNTRLTDREFEFYTRSHCDFVLTDAQARPLMIVEYDGPLHQSSAKQQERDEIKNELCRQAEIGLLRINDRYVTKLYRGMSVLRWIVEVTELEKAFYEAQEKGDIPWDEPFDPAFLQPVDSSSRFPYWLSASATQSFHNFFKTLDPDIPKGWNGISDGAPVDFGDLQPVQRLALLEQVPLDAIVAPRPQTRALVREEGLQQCAHGLGRANSPFNFLVGGITTKADLGMQFGGGLARLCQRHRSSRAKG